jgi:superfamily II DNA or RNA helicase
MATKKSKVDPVVARSMLRAAYLDDKNQQQAARVTHLSTRAARFNADAQFGSPPKAARLSDGVYRALLRTWLPKANATTVDALTTAVRAGLSGAALKEPVDNKAQQLKFLQNRKLTTNLKANLRRTFRSSHLDTKTIPINELSPSKPSKPLDLDGKGASPPFALYPHQIEARAHLEALWNESSAFRGRLVLPTGAGKTDTVAGWALNHLALDPSLRVFWLVHQQELADQAMARFVAIAAQQRIGFHRRGRVIHSAGSALSTLAEDSLDVACLTYQSFTQLDTKKRKLLGRFLTRPTIIVVDEAHHAGAPSYDALLNLAEDTSDVRAIIGLTATPYPSAPSARFRFNTRFPQLVHSVDAGTLIRQGILARPLVTAVDTGLALDLTDAQVTVSTQTDIPSEVLRQLDDKNRNDLIVRTWKADPRRWGKTLVFAPTISHADSLARRFSRAGATTRSLHSYSADRIGTLEWFRNTSGPTVLVSVGMLTEGVDLPDAKTAFLARPTTSPILMRQMVGRVLRGPKAGGGAEAEVVYFRDTWRNLPDVLLPGEVLPDSRPAPGGRDAPSWSLGAIVDDDDLELRSDLAALIAHAFDALAPLFDLDDSDPFNDSPPAPLVNGSRLVGFYDIDEMPVPVFAHQVTGVESLLRDALEFDLKGTAFLSYFDDTASSNGRCTVPVMMTGAVDPHRPLETTPCQARRCRCPNARRSASR